MTIMKIMTSTKRPANRNMIALMVMIMIISLMGLFLTASCTTGKGSTKKIGENTVRIHYIRSDENYENKTLWIWEDTTWKAKKGWPHGMDWTGKTDKGVYYDVPLKPGANKLGFLVVDKTKGDAGKDGGDKMFSMLGQFKEVWIKQGDDNVYISSKWEKPVGIASATLGSDKSIDTVFVSTEGLTAQDIKKNISVKNASGKAVTVRDVKIANDKQTVVLNLDVDIEEAPYTISYGGRSVQASAGWPYIDGVYAYDGWLGPKLKKDGTAILKMWSPLVKDVKVILYDKDNHDKVVKDNIPMTKGDNGVWTVTLNKENTGLDSLRGYYYNYKVDASGDGNARLALDPYAPSMAAFNDKKYNIGRGAIVDIDSVGPKLNYASIPGFKKRADTIIWEAHVRDFTVDPAIEDELDAPFGTFEAFIDKLDYIKSLGVTHVQLLPVMSYKHGNELASREREMEYSAKNQNYNWGYDPLSYFSLSGMYSKNPKDPELRIKEFKKLVEAVHARGMGVILDVVYNHTADVRIFEDLAPGYYHFMTKDGKPKTSFGGGRLGTTHAMSRKILVDSILHWTREYNVDGFRFDMMGDHDAASIQKAYDEASKLNPNIVMIGEGWRTYAGDDGDKRQPADQDWMSDTEGVAVFSDEFRNELKSGFGCEGQPRFLTGGARSIQGIFDNIKAQPGNIKADSPGDVVPYIAAHDNLPLHDVIAHSIKKDPDNPESSKEIHRRIRIGNAMVLTSQGIAFIHAGQEYGRTKQWRAPGKPEHKETKMVTKDGKPFKYPWFVHDSYDSSDIINKFNWAKATDSDKYPVHTLTRRYTEGLIDLRRSTDAFRLGSQKLVNKNVTLIKAPEIKSTDLVIAYRCEATNGDAYHVFVNADTKKRPLTLDLDKDLSSGTVLVDDDESGTKAVKKPSGYSLDGKSIELEPLTVVIIKK